jgi:TonB family protein
VVVSRRVNATVRRNNRGWSLSTYSIIRVDFEGKDLMKWFALRFGTPLLAFAIGIAASSFWSLNHSLAMPQKATDTPAIDCGCSSYSDVPCLVSAVEDTLNQKVISKPQPPYPAEAKAAHVSGDVSVGVIIDKTGKVIFAWLEKGDVALSSAALDAVYELRVKPTLLSGKPVNVKSVVTYRFRLP